MRKLRRECKDRRMSKAKDTELVRRDAKIDMESSTADELGDSCKEQSLISVADAANSRTEQPLEMAEQQLKKFAHIKSTEQVQSKTLHFVPAHAHAPAPTPQPQVQAQPSAMGHVHVQIQSQAVLHALTEEQQQRKDQKSIDLTTALERLQLEHHELQQKKLHINDASDGMNHRNQLHLLQRHQMRKMAQDSSDNAFRAFRQQRQMQHLSPGDEGDRFYTPEGTVRQAEPMGQEMSSGEKADDSAKASSASAAFVCYKTRLSRLEEEMAKCKRQLFHYVQDNQQLLAKQSLRQHIERLLHSSPLLKTSKSEPAAPIASAKSPQSDSGIDLDQPKLDRDKQKQLQLREFLARDESNANAYELPDLCNVYKTSSCHAQPLSSCLETPSSCRPLSSTSTNTNDNSIGQELIQQSHNLAHVYSNYFPVAAVKTNSYENAWNKREHAHGHNAKRHQPLAPNCDRLRIQEANFYDSFNDSHATRK